MTVFRGCNEYRVQASEVGQKPALSRPTNVEKFGQIQWRARNLYPQILSWLHPCISRLCHFVIGLRFCLFQTIYPLSFRLIFFKLN